MIFQRAILHAAEVASTLDTITAEHEGLQVSIHLPSFGPDMTTEEMDFTLNNLDCALTRLRELHPNCIKVIFEVCQEDDEFMETFLNHYFPTMMEVKGHINLSPQNGEESKLSTPTVVQSTFSSQYAWFVPH